MNRDLDRKIAELNGYTTRDQAGGPVMCTLNLDKSIKTVEQIPFYSSSIQAAWPLFEEIQPEIYIVQIKAGGWKVRDHEGSCAYLPESVWAKTAPEAICMAWIKWKEMKVCFSE